MSTTFWGGIKIIITASIAAMSVLCAVLCNHWIDEAKHLDADKFLPFRVLSACAHNSSMLLCY